MALKKMIDADKICADQLFLRKSASSFRLFLRESASQGRKPINFL